MRCNGNDRAVVLVGAHYHSGTSRNGGVRLLGLVGLTNVSARQRQASFRLHGATLRATLGTPHL